MKLWAVTFLVTSALVAQGPAAKSALDKKTFESYVRRLVLYPPHVQVAVADPTPSEVPGFMEIKVHASAGAAAEDRVFYVSKDGQKVLEAKVYDINQSPFKAELEKIKTDGAPMLGTPGSPVTIVLFSDFQCGYCAQEGKAIRTELLKTFPTQVQLYFKDFPIQQIHPWAKPAAIAGRCVAQQKPAAFWEYHDWVFGKQNEIKPEDFNQKFTEWAASKSLNAGQLDACRSSKQPEAEIERTTAEGRALGVTSTPTMFINGRRIGGSVPWDNLKQIIELEIGYASEAKKEECCALPALSPVKKQ